MSKIGSYVQVVVHTPTHSALSQALLYRSEQLPSLGALVIVPLGKKNYLGVVWGHLQCANDALPDGLNPDKIQPIHTVLSALPPLQAARRT